MKNLFQKKFTIQASNCNSQAQLSHADTFALFCDVATDHANVLDVSAKTLAPKGLFWVAVKTKIAFENPIKMMDEATLSTWPAPPEKLRCVRFYKLESNDKIVATGKTEWAILSFSSNRPQLVSDIYPKDLEYHNEKVCESPFVFEFEDFSNSERFERVVKYSDIDLSHHVNNVAYVRMAFDTLSTNEVENTKISEIDVIYRRQCYEKDTLTICKKATQEHIDFSFEKPDGTVATLIRIKIEKNA